MAPLDDLPTLREFIEEAERLGCSAICRDGDPDQPLALVKKATNVRRALPQIGVDEHLMPDVVRSLETSLEIQTKYSSRKRGGPENLDQWEDDEFSD